MPSPLKRTAHDALKLPPVALAFGLYFVATAIYFRFALPADAAPALITLCAVFAFAAFVFWGAMRALVLSPHYTPVVLSALLVLAVIAALNAIRLTGELRYTTLLLPIVAVAGVLLRQTGWCALVLTVVVGGWAFVLPPAASPATRLHFGFALGMATTAASAVHVLQRGSDKRGVQLRRQNTQFETSLRRQTAHMEVGIAVSARINAASDLDTLLDQIVAIVRARYGYTYVGIFLLNESGDELIARAGTGSAGRAAIANGTRIKVGRGVIGWVAENRRVAYARDASRDARFVVWDLRPDTRSELTLPLHVGEQLLGVLDLQSDRTHAFPEDDAAAIGLLVDHVSLAVRNMQLMQTDSGRHRFTETLYHIGRALSRPINRQAVLDLILQQLAGVIPHERGAILLQNGNALDLVAVRGFPNRRAVPRRHVPIRPGDVYSEIQRTQRVLVLDDALRRSDWYHLDDLLPARSWMGVPLILQEQVIGMLSLAREMYVPYTEEERAFATAFAWQIAIALDNARLHARLARGRGSVRPFQENN